MVEISQALTYTILMILLVRKYDKFIGGLVRFFMYIYLLIFVLRPCTSLLFILTSEKQDYFKINKLGGINLRDMGRGIVWWLCTLMFDVTMLIFKRIEILLNDKQAKMK